MSLLSFKQLCRLIDDGVIENSSHENVNSASIDLVLGRNIMIEKQRSGVINMLDKGSDNLERIHMPDA